MAEMCHVFFIVAQVGVRREAGAGDIFQARLRRPPMLRPPTGEKRPVVEANSTARSGDLSHRGLGRDCIGWENLSAILALRNILRFQFAGFAARTAVI